MNYETFRLIIQGMVCITLMMIAYCGTFIINDIFIKKSTKIDLGKNIELIEDSKQCVDIAKKEIQEARENNKTENEIRSIKIKYARLLIVDYDPDDAYFQEIYLKSLRMSKTFAVNANICSILMNDRIMKYLRGVWDYCLRSSVEAYGMTICIIAIMDIMSL